ncbi:MAG TPA: DUF4105 domain-containing protein [Polyangiaceae bacterium]|nr:DUF4105 domain-containing protein [Polyangiaceae bacterium]
MSSQLRAWCALALLVGAFCLTRVAQGQGPASTADVPTISVLTFGPGDETFSKFGHDALWVHDPRQPASRRDLVYNYGTFRFDSPWLIVDFLKGRLSYWLSVSSLQRTLAVYRTANRSVRAQELALSPEQALALTAFVVENAKPENAAYRYDYYRDNCATRIRDVLDRHLGGGLQAASTGPAQWTYRDHTRRLTAGAPVLLFALDLALGPLIDRPISEWEEMFLPGRVEAKLAQLKLADGRPLVRRARSLFEARRAPEPERPPGFRWGWLGAGVAIGAALWGLGRLGRAWSRVAFAAAVGAIGALGGVLGGLLLVLWLLTDHEVTYFNQNVLLCPVWGLALPLLARDLARAAPRRLRATYALLGAAALAALAALVLRALLPHSQHTGPALAFFVPQWLAAALAVRSRVASAAPALAHAGRGDGPSEARADGASLEADE